MENKHALQLESSWNPFQQICFAQPDGAPQNGATVRKLCLSVVKEKERWFEFFTPSSYTLYFKQRRFPLCSMHSSGHYPCARLGALSLTPHYSLKGKQNTLQRAARSAYRSTNLTHHIFNHSDVCTHVLHALGLTNLIIMSICIEPCTLSVYK